MKTKLFDSTVIREAQEAMDFMANVMEASTEYSIIGKDLDGRILLWNEGARRMYGYEADEMVGKANSEILRTPEDVALGKPQEIMQAELRDGRWEGVIGRIRKDKRHITARVVIITPRKDGREVLAEIKSDPALRHIPAVILTTSKADQDVIQTYDLGANAYVVKPVDLDQLVTIVQKIEEFWFSIVKLPRG